MEQKVVRRYLNTQLLNLELCHTWAISIMFVICDYYVCLCIIINIEITVKLEANARLILLLLHEITKILNCTSTETGLTRRDVVCQRELTQVSAAWEPFDDPETRITRCVNGRL